MVRLVSDGEAEGRVLAVRAGRGVSRARLAVLLACAIPQPYLEDAARQTLMDLVES